MKFTLYWLVRFHVYKRVILKADDIIFSMKLGTLLIYSLQIVLVLTSTICSIKKMEIPFKIGTSPRAVLTGSIYNFKDQLV